MPTTPSLRLPEDVTTTLFRMVTLRLRKDKLLASAIRTWREWEGRPGDKDAPAPTGLPWMRLSCRSTGEDWFSPETQLGRLVIEIEAVIPGTCLDDVFNLWGAVRRAIYDPNDRDGWLAFVNRLQTAGAHKGLILMSQPLAEQGGADDGQWQVTGSLAIDYRAPAAS